MLGLLKKKEKEMHGWQYPEHKLQVKLKAVINVDAPVQHI